MTTEMQSDPSLLSARPEDASRAARWKTIGKVMAGFIPLFLVLQLLVFAFYKYLGDQEA